MKNVVILILLIACIVLLYKYPATEMTYDCRLAEISPDVPQDIKNDCREMMKE